MVLVALLLPTSAVADDWGLEVLLQLLASESRPEVAFVEERDVELLQTRTRAEGRMRFDPPDTYVRELHSPYHQRLTIAGEEVIVEEDGEERHRLHRDDDAGLAALARLMAALYGQADADELADYFRIGLSGERGEWRLVLTPSEARARQRIERITLFGSGGRVERTEVREASGDRSVTRFLEE